MADYIGLGDSPGFHPYLHAATEATAARDLVLAYAAQEQRKHVDLLITGYSQGGHSAAALHRAIEANSDSRISVLASSPMAGPYEPDGASLTGTLDDPEPRASALYSAYALLAYQDVYGDIFADPREVFSTQFAGISAIFHAQKEDEINAVLPSLPSELFRPEFIRTLRDNPDHPFRKHLRENDLTDWTPKAPIQFVYAGGDKVVPGGNAIAAFAQIGRRSKLVSIVNVGDDMGHNTGVLSAFYATIKFFREFR